MSEPPPQTGGQQPPEPDPAYPDWLTGADEAPFPLLADMPDPHASGVVSAHDLCLRLEAVLREHLPALAAAYGLDPVLTWQQLPTAQAISAAALPANAVTSPGLSDTPSARRGRYGATWRLVAAMYDRGTDHADTSRRARTWAALIRQTVLRHRRLGGLVTTLDWVGEDYGLIPEVNAARTLSGCSVMFDAYVEDVVDVGLAQPDGSPTPLPLVQSTQTATVLRPAQDPTARVTRSSVTVRPPTPEA